MPGGRVQAKWQPRATMPELGCAIRGAKEGPTLRQAASWLHAPALASIHRTWRSVVRKRFDGLPSGQCVLRGFHFVGSSDCPPEHGAFASGLHPGWLDYATVGTERRHMVGLIQEPESLPFLHHGSEVFRGVDQLFRSSSWIRRIDRQGTANQR